jgi:hypothetical protein
MWSYGKAELFIFLLHYGMGVYIDISGAIQYSMLTTYVWLMVSPKELHKVLYKELIRVPSSE